MFLPLPSRQECVGAKSKDWQTEGQVRDTLGAQWTGFLFSYGNFDLYRKIKV
jgi:hypothetical protein